MKKSVIDNDIAIELINKILDKKYRLNQILSYIYKKNILDFTLMSNLPKKIRDALKKKYTIINIKEIKKEISKDFTVKFLFELEDKNCIESVILIDKNKRYTFCISTQSGCRMGCKFCKTGKMGLLKNLHYSEILSQILLLSSYINKSFNIVFMGMGEPFDNIENLSKAIDILTDKTLFNISQKKITISTCGVTNKLESFFDKFPRINLAVSLNNPIQEKREKIIPIAKTFKLGDLFNTLKSIYNKNKNRITLEYVLIKNFNMGIEEINEFKKINKNIFLINVIPHNNEKIEEKEIKTFLKQLSDIGFNVTRRYKRGNDINAACGQLYWNFKK